MKFDPDFLKTVRDRNRPLIEMLFAYGFVLAETDFAYEHVVLFSKIWAEEVEKRPDLDKVIATFDLDTYRQIIGAENIHPSIKNLTGKITRPCLASISQLTHFKVSYGLETRGDKEKGKTRQSSTHITFEI